MVISLSHSVEEERPQKSISNITYRPFFFTMKVSIAVSLLVSAPTAFALITSRPKPSFLGLQQHHTATRLNAEIRAPTEKAQELRYVRLLTVHSQHMEFIMHA